MSEVRVTKPARTELSVRIRGYEVQSLGSFFSGRHQHTDDCGSFGANIVAMSSKPWTGFTSIVNATASTSPCSRTIRCSRRGCRSLDSRYQSCHRVRAPGSVRLPTTQLLYAGIGPRSAAPTASISSRASRSSGPFRMASTFDCNCASVDAPKSTALTTGCDCVHRRASSSREIPAVAAIFLSDSTDSNRRLSQYLSR